MIVGYEDVCTAANLLKGIANKTPVHTSRTLSERYGANVYLKCENFQRSGAFKFRGAYYSLKRLSESQRKNGVLTFSSGNHAQALALAGKLLGIRVTVVMPTDAPLVKKNATIGYGGEVILYDPCEASRESLGNEIAHSRNLTIIPPYDHPDIIAGQGTAIKELIEEVGPLDAIFVPCGGGGLLAGSAISVRELLPKCKVIGVEPEAADDACRSFRSKTIQTVNYPETIADGARTPSLGALNFEIILQKVEDIISVHDDALLQATHFLWERMKLVVEPTGALGLAGFIKSHEIYKNLRIGILISGGNADFKALSNHWVRLSL